MCPSLCHKHRETHVKDLNLSLIGSILASNHAEESGFATAIRPDNSHDAATWQGEGEVSVEIAPFKRLGDALEVNHYVAEARAGRDEQVGCALALLKGSRLFKKLLIRAHSRFALGLARLGV